MSFCTIFVFASFYLGLEFAQKYKPLKRFFASNSCTLERNRIHSFHILNFKYKGHKVFILHSLPFFTVDASILCLKVTSNKGRASLATNSILFC